MTDAISAVHGILREELVLYSQVYSIEEKKSRAIVDKDPKLLQVLLAEQDATLEQISVLEASRVDALKTFISENGIGSGREITLTELASRAEGEAGAKIMRTGGDLKEMILRIRDLSATNEKMIQDTMEFYSILLNDLKRKVSLKTGYNRQAVEESSIENPLLFCRKA